MKTLILDFDGTIADTSEAILKCVTLTLKHLGIPNTDSEAVRRMIGLPLKDTFSKAAGITDDTIIDRCITTYRTIFADICGRYIRLFPGVKDTIETLNLRGIDIAIASSRGKESLISLTNHLGIAEHIKLILGEEDVTNPKPAPDMAEKIMRTLNVTPSDTLVVGDTTFDIEMGNAAGCNTCGVTYGNHCHTQLLSAHPTHIIDSFPALLNILRH